MLPPRHAGKTCPGDPPHPAVLPLSLALPTIQQARAEAKTMRAMVLDEIAAVETAPPAFARFAHPRAGAG